MVSTRSCNLRPLIRYALSASLAGLVVAAAVAGVPARASAQTVGASEADTITTVLHPGWNMVGWLGSDAPATDLFDAIPALRRVSAWDGEEQLYRRRTGTSIPPNGLERLTAGMGIWLQLGGDEPFEWRRPARADSVVLSLRPGRNLVGWAGRDGTAIAGATARFRSELIHASRWDAESQLFLRYSEGGSESANTLTVLNHGDALWIELTADARWWQSGRSPVPVLFVGDVLEEDQAEIREWVDETRAVFAERWAVEATFSSYVGELAALTPTYQEIRGIQVPDGFCADYLSGVVFARTDCLSRGTYPHEYFHVLQDALARRGSGPAWLVEGSASWAAVIYRGVTSRELTLPERLDLELGSSISSTIRADLPALMDLERGVTFYSYGGAGYHLGFVAADWLVDHSSEQALFDFYSALGPGRSWRRAFESAFGVAVDDFYGEFERYRAEVAPRLPHLVDESDEPVLVLLGDMSPEEEARIRTRFANVQTFFAERFDAGTGDYTVYVGANAESLAGAFKLLFGREIEENFCKRTVTATAVILTLACDSGDPRGLAGAHFDNLRHRLAPWASLPDPAPGDDRWGPGWLTRATESYVGSVYEATIGTRTFGEIRQDQIRLAARTAGPLPALSGGFDSRRAVSFLAGEWLAKRAGESALVDYYRALPSSANWEQAFETAFGIPVDDFHVEFERYRAEVAPPFALHHVRGVLSDPSGNPATGTWIGADRRDGTRGWEGSVRTGSDGAFDLPLRDGTYDLNALCEIQSDARLHLVGEVVVRGGDVTGLDLRLPEGSFCG